MTKHTDLDRITAQGNRIDDLEQYLRSAEARIKELEDEIERLKKDVIGRDIGLKEMVLRPWNNDEWEPPTEEEWKAYVKVMENEAKR